MVKAFALVASANAFIAILRHWKGYDGSEKFVAVVLLSFLIMMPASATWKWGGARFEWSSLWSAYIVLMLATILFAR
jgi:hypothetical protein